MTKFVIQCEPMNPAWKALFTFGPYESMADTPGGAVPAEEIPGLAEQIARFKAQAAALGFRQFTVVPWEPGMVVNDPATLGTGSYMPEPDRDGGG